MRLLLDTHAVIWWMEDNLRLPAEVRAEIGNPDNEVFVSAASAWEIGIKRKLGKLDAPGDLITRMEAARLLPLEISLRHAIAAGDLPRHHDDPFDRILVAQVTIEGMKLASRDERLKAYAVELLWS